MTEAGNALSRHVGMQYPTYYRTSGTSLSWNPIPIVASLVHIKAKEVMERYNLG
jgi:hypothetical protein